MRLRPGFTLDDAQRELAYVYDLFDGLRDSQVGEAVNAHRYLSAVDTATPISGRSTTPTSQRY